jgi:hypothetical protein
VITRLFKTSQGLVDLFLKYGFTDNTAKLYPEHFRRLSERGYDPYSMKRIFCYPPHPDCIIFHYVYINLHHHGAFNHTEEKTLLTEDELRSLITFYKLPLSDANEWLDAYKNALDLHKYYRKICQLPEVFNSLLDKRIKETFELVIIR